MDKEIGDVIKSSELAPVDIAKSRVLATAT